MRTDSTQSVGGRHIGMARGYIEKNFGCQDLPRKTQYVQNSKDGAQEAHEPSGLQKMSKEDR